MWSLSKLTAPVWQAERVAERPPGKERRVFSFPQRMFVLIQHSLRLTQKSMLPPILLGRRGCRLEGPFGILHQLSQKPLEELDLASARGLPDTRCRIYCKGGVTTLVVGTQGKGCLPLPRHSLVLCMRIWIWMGECQCIVHYSSLSPRASCRPETWTHCVSNMSNGHPKSVGQHCSGGLISCRASKEILRRSVGVICSLGHSPGARACSWGARTTPQAWMWGGHHMDILGRCALGKPWTHLQWFKWVGLPLLTALWLPLVSRYFYEPRGLRMTHSAEKFHLIWPPGRLFLPSFVLEQKLVHDSSIWRIIIMKYPQRSFLFSHRDFFLLFCSFFWPLQWEFRKKKELN